MLSRIDTPLVILIVVEPQVSGDIALRLGGGINIVPLLVVEGANLPILLQIKGVKVQELHQTRPVIPRLLILP